VETQWRTDKTRHDKTERKTLLMLGQERRCNVSKLVYVGLYCQKHRDLKMGRVKLG
jgi:hypothetical protein